jgi:hypothetical protein
MVGTRPGRRRAVVAAVAVLLLLPLQPTAGARRASASKGQAFTKLEFMGRSSLRKTAAQSSTADRASSRGPEFAPVPPSEGRSEEVFSGRAPRPDATGVTEFNPGLSRFGALRHADSRLASNGNQFSVEPPDQALCVGQGLEMEVVNQALAVYDANGNQRIPATALNDFYGVAPSIRRDLTRPTFGPFVFDPVCHYDAQVDRWFVVTTELDQDVFTGAFTGGSNIYIAVSLSEDPTGAYAFFGLNTTNGSPLDRGCPCFDDFPQIGFDANGFYTAVNRFSIFDRPFNGAYIHAISKQGLVAAADGTAATPTVVSVRGGRAGGEKADTVHPAIAPPGGAQAPNREYFLSSLNGHSADAENQVVVWALSNTASLSRATPNVNLTRSVISSRRYTPPPKSTQKPGPRPLGNSLDEPVRKLDSGDYRMRQVYFSGGNLWSALGTGVGRGRAGILWLKVRPTFAAGQVGGAVTAQGYVSVAGNNVLYPAVAMNKQSRGAMVFSIVGPDRFPSAAYTHMGPSGRQGPVHIAKKGAGPEDGFTCYKAFVGDEATERGCRWGDYSAARVGQSGNIWMATEFIPNFSRTDFANWGTVVAHLER